MEKCKTIQKIPKRELDRVISESQTASAEMDLSFLCFEEVYERVSKFCNKETIILDFGCSYAAQSYWFTHCKKYIGIDLPFYNNVKFRTNNSEIYLMSGQDFIKNELPKLNINQENIVAVCSYVPDEELQKMVSETFKYNYVQYCGNIISDTLAKVNQRSIKVRYEC